MHYQSQVAGYSSAQIEQILASKARIPDGLIDAINLDMDRGRAQARSRQWTPIEAYSDSVIAGNRLHQLEFDIYKNSSGRLGWARNHHHIHELNFTVNQLTPFAVGELLISVLREQAVDLHYSPEPNRFAKINKGLVGKILADIKH